MNILIVVFGYLFIFSVSEFLHKKYSWQSEYTRKVAHVGASLFSLAVPHLVNRIQITGIGIFFFIALIITKRISYLKSIHQVQRHTLGALLFPITIVILAWLTWYERLPAYYYAILILGFSDTLAAVFGKGKKITSKLSFFPSCLGSLVYFLMTMLISLVILASIGQEIPIISVITVSFILTIVERYSPWGVDNTSVPIVAVFLFQNLLIT